MTSKVFPIFPASATPLWFIVAIVVVLVAVIAVFTFIAFSTKQVTFELTDSGLRVRGGLYGRFIPKEALIRERARIVNLTIEREYKPRLRTNGVGLPGYDEGWFRLKNGEKAFVYMTEATQVVYIPTTKGYSVLLTPNQPDEFLRALRDW